MADESIEATGDDEVEVATDVTVDVYDLSGDGEADTVADTETTLAHVDNHGDPDRTDEV